MVFVIDGTIPTFYKGNVYGIPIDIWVPLGYPTDSLKARMVSNDEETMSIKLSHLYVDARVGGLVDMSYMHT